MKMKNNYIDYDQYNKIEKSPNKACILYAGLSIALIFIPDIHPIIFWMKKLYLLSIFIFTLVIGIYRDYPANLYVYSNKETKRQMRKILGVDETLSDAEQEKHPLVKKIRRQNFCTNMSGFVWFITSVILMLQGYFPFT